MDGRAYTGGLWVNPAGDRNAVSNVNGRPLVRTTCLRTYDTDLRHVGLGRRNQHPGAPVESADDWQRSAERLRRPACGRACFFSCRSAIGKDRSGCRRRNLPRRKPAYVRARLRRGQSGYAHAPQATSGGWLPAFWLRQPCKMSEELCMAIHGPAEQPPPITCGPSWYRRSLARSADRTGRSFSSCREHGNLIAGM